MVRLACVDLPAFPLQLLLRRHPDWQPLPVAVVDSDRPQGVLLWVNAQARTRRILPGMRYAAALSLAGELRAAEVSREEIAHAVDAIGRRLHRFTPHVEPAGDEPGVFRLDASGLERLHDSLADWAGLIRADLRRAGLDAAVVVGFDRFAVYAVARAKRGVVIFSDPAGERAAARRVPLDRLFLAPRVRDALERLGVRTVGAFVDLPEEGLHKRFGPEVQRLHRLAAGRSGLPLQPETPAEPVLQHVLLDQPERNAARLLHVLERMLPPLLRTLADGNRTLTELRLRFVFERGKPREERLRPAAPTLDTAQLLELIRLRLEATRLPEGAIELQLAAEGIAATREQLGLFADKPHRDLDAANRALARVRAELGDGAVLCARLREGHLPEGRFEWGPLERMVEARPRNVENGTLVRRIFVRSVPLPSRPRHEPDGWMLRGLEQGPVTRVLGPYVVSGGWWRRLVHREYHFAETQRGELLWVYYDRIRRRWFLQGRVE